MWNRTLERFNSTSVHLQYANLDLNEAVSLYDSLKEFISFLREEFYDIEDKAKKLTKCNQYKKEYERKQKRTVRYDANASESSNQSTEYDCLPPNEIFKIEVAFVILDKVSSSLNARKDAYKNIAGIFGPIRNLDKDFETNADKLKNIKTVSKAIVNAYPEDIEDCLEDELLQFTTLLEKSPYEPKIDKSKTAKFSLELQYYNLIRTNDLQAMFPNLEIALRIYLSMMVTNCSGERSFSKLSLIKNKLRSTIGQEKLNDLVMMSIECTILRDMDTDLIINKFAHHKARKTFHK